MRTALLAMAVLMLGACVSSNSTTCGNNLVCPSGTSCGPTGDKCVDSNLLDACHGASDGVTCSVAGLPPGKCLGSVCQASRCGDGRVTGAEDCDGAQVQGKTCLNLGFYAPGALGCTSDCKFDTSQCVGKCGDGIKNGPEDCDGQDFGGATCFNAGYYGANTIGCKSDCTFDTSQCTGGRCGDGIINGLEQCDGEALNNATCTTLGYTGAMTGLKCSSTCTYTASSCRCTADGRCAATTQRCDCPKTGGCGCVAK